MDTYPQKHQNDSTLGKTFEDLYLLWSFLNLQDNEALAREIDDELKFDDLVIRALKDSKTEYRCFQLKHKDTSINNNHCITWNELLLEENGQFSLQKYFKSFLLRDKTTNISELGVVTNITFSISSRAYAQGFTDILQLTKNVSAITANVSPTPKKVSKKSQTKKNSQRQQIRYVTKEDVEFYFEAIPHMDRRILGTEQRFKFSKVGLQHVKIAFTTLDPSANDSELQQFLGLIVFHIGLPHAIELEKIINCLVKIYFPFNWDTANLERYQQIKNQIFELFKPIAKKQAKWITAQNRLSIFQKLAQEFKKENIIGSVESYEANVLEVKYNEMHFEQLICTPVKKTPLQIVLKNFIKERENNILNIWNSKSNTTVTSLKLLKFIKSYELQQKALIILVNDDKGVKNVTTYFKNLKSELFELRSLVEGTFVCVIEIPPFHLEYSKQFSFITEELRKLGGLKEWIRFVVITQHPLQEKMQKNANNENSRVTIKLLEDSSLEWKDLPEEAKEHLAKKPLLIEEFAGCTTNLEALGLSDKLIAEQMNSSSLAELITLDKQKPLCFGLAEYDINLESIYIDRKLKLPLVNIENMDDHLKNRIIFDRHEECSQDTDKNQFTRHYLLKPGLKDEQKSNHYIWSKSSSPEGFKEIRQHVTRSSDSTLEISETHLIQEDVCFGNGSEGGKLVIVVDLPGKGKSWLLSNLTNEFLDKALPKQKNELLSRLMFRINLLEIKQSVWDKSITMTGNTTMEEKLTYITEQMLGLETSKLSACIMKMCLTNSDSSLYFLLDGFDEISDKQRETIKSVVQVLLSAEGVKRVILASRPDGGLEKILEEVFLQFPLHLTDLDKQDQIELLMKRWKRKQGDQEYEQNETLIKEYAKSLVDYAQEALIAKNKTFLDIPLQCMIVSECFYPNLLKFLKNTEKPNLDSPQFTNENFELLRLYDDFVKTKMEIMFENKANLFADSNETLGMLKIYLKSLLEKENKANQSDGNETLGMIILDLVSLLENVMKRLAIFHMMRATLSNAETICRLPWDLYRKAKYAEDLKRAMKLGMIHGLSVAKSFSKLEAPHAKFLHRTFAEYFFAKFLIDNFTGAEIDLLNNHYHSEVLLEKTFEIIFENVFTGSEFAGVRRFFNRMLSEHLPAEEQKCPFATEDWFEVCTKWPCIGHQEFNWCLVKWIKKFQGGACDPQSFCDLQTVKDVSKWINPSEEQHIDVLESKTQSNRSTDKGKSKNTSKYTIDMRESTNTLAKGFQAQKQINLNYVLNTLRWDTQKIALMLMYCIKEYQCRPDVSQNEKNLLANDIALIIVRIASVGDEFSPDWKWMMGVYLRWFDPPVKGQSSSETFFIILNNLVFYGPTKRVVQALDLGCSLVEHHRNAIGDFDEQIKILVRNFIGKKDLLVEYTSFKSENVQEMKRMAEQFLKFLSLSELLLTDTSLLDWLAKRFQDLLKNEYIRVNPFTITESADFLIKALQQSKNEKEKENIAECYFEFLNKKLISLYDKPSNEDQKSSLWLMILSDRIVKTKQICSVLKFFKTRIGKSILIAYANGYCCRHERATRIPLPINDLPLMDHLNQWLKEKLNTLWNEVEEFEFIDFLFKRQQHQLMSPAHFQEEQEDATCLFSSHLVRPYISNGFTKEGLEYLVEICTNDDLPAAPIDPSSSLPNLTNANRRCVEEIRSLRRLLNSKPRKEFVQRSTTQTKRRLKNKTKIKSK